MANITYDPEKFQLTLARFKKGGHIFEVVVDPDLAIALRDGKDVEMQDVLQSDDIFADAQKGQLAPNTLFTEIFGEKLAEDSVAIAKHIILEGELHLTAEYKRQLREKKRKQVIQLIATNGVDPRTGLPHPPARIETALEGIKVKIDEFASAKSQIKPILKAMQEVLPIRFETKELEIRIPAQFAGKAYGALKDIKFSKWENDGSLRAIVQIPGGLEQELYSNLNNLTQGTVEIKQLGKTEE